MSAPKTGHDLTLSYNSGTHASPTWVEIADVEDVSIDELAWAMAEVKRRSSRMKKSIATILSAALTFKLLHELNATIFDALVGIFFARTPTEFYIASGPVATAGTKGLRMYCQIEQFPWNQPLEDISSHDVRAVPTFFEESGSEVDLDWYEISE